MNKREEDRMSRAILVQGLAYGDECKGATVDFLCRQLPVDLVVRFNGGSQAAHNVCTTEGAHHTFSQFGSGTLAGEHVRTHLSRFMLVDPLTMMNEAAALREQLGVQPWRGLTVDPRCVIITPFHKQVNRLREMARGLARHGSCGMGVGVAREWQLKYGDAVLYAEDVLDTQKVTEKLRFLLNLACQEFGVTLMSYSEINLRELAYTYAKWPVVLDTMPKSDLAVFEGAQGVLLDETHGEAPYHTWTDCTFNNADTLCAEAGITDRFRVGCARAYLTRHGAGPLPGALAHDPAWHPAEPHNVTNEFQGPFRVAPMNFFLLRKAMSYIGSLDCLAISHLDVYGGGVLDTRLMHDLLGVFEQELATPIGIKAWGPTALNREFTPAWTTAWARILEEAAQ
jgi:adenylosuccinate synthase